MQQPRNHYPQSFKDRVLDDYFQSGASLSACAGKWQIPVATLQIWLASCTSREKAVSLRPKSNRMDAKDQALENLRIENEKLRRALEYQKLKVAGYERLLEIVRQEDGIDLLKKGGAKQ